MRELGRSDAGDIALTTASTTSRYSARDGGQNLASATSVSPSTTYETSKLVSKISLPQADIRQEEGGLFHGDYRVTDPSGQTVSLSTHHFTRLKIERTFPCIRHLAVCVPNNDAVLDFYVNVFGFRESTTPRWIRPSLSTV